MLTVQMVKFVQIMFASPALHLHLHRLVVVFVLLLVLPVSLSAVMVLHSHVSKVMDLFVYYLEV